MKTCAFENEGRQLNDETQRKRPIVTMVYKVADLPVWTSDKDFDPVVLMRLIQVSVPSDWTSEHAKSTIDPYPQKASLVISTRPENHDKIVDLLESMRSQK
ncbi:MAG: hypothetical protein AAGG48_27670 [Planctomycetota bacterium]